jgi:squalene cyclase
MRRLRCDAVSYVLKYGRGFNRLRLAQVMGWEGEYPRLGDELRALQNGDGGWPWMLDAGNPSGVSDTAKVVELIVSVGVDPSSEPIRMAIAYLLKHQNRDGGWSESPELEGVIPPQWTWVSTEHSGYQTADVLNALLKCGHAGKEVERGVEFLRGSQNEEGGWRSHVGPDRKPVTDIATTDHIVAAFLRSGEPRDSTTIRRAEEMLLEKAGDMDSAVNLAAALSCLRALGYEPDDWRLTGLVDRLMACQRPDGGWNWFGDLPSNPAQTVDCLEALWGSVEMV